MVVMSTDPWASPSGSLMIVSSWLGAIDLVVARGRPVGSVGLLHDGVRVSLGSTGSAAVLAPPPLSRISQFRARLPVLRRVSVLVLVCPAGTTKSNAAGLISARGVRR